MGRGGESKGHHYHPEYLQDTPGTSSPRPQGANFHDVKGKLSRGLIMNTFEVFKFIFLNIDLCKGPWQVELYFLQTKTFPSLSLQTWHLCPASSEASRGGKGNLMPGPELWQAGILFEGMACWESGHMVTFYQPPHPHSPQQPFVIQKVPISNWVCFRQMWCCPSCSRRQERFLPRQAGAVQMAF